MSLTELLCIKEVHIKSKKGYPLSIKYKRGREAPQIKKRKRGSQMKDRRIQNFIVKGKEIFIEGSRPRLTVVDN